MQGGDTVVLGSGVHRVVVAFRHVLKKQSQSQGCAEVCRGKECEKNILRREEEAKQLRTKVCLCSEHFGE